MKRRDVKAKILWWARRPLAAARAVIFTSLVDDPDDPNAYPEFVEACRKLPGDRPNVSAKGDSPRMRLFDFIERLVTWEATTDDKTMGPARELIRIATNGNPPPLLDPFSGEGRTVLFEVTEGKPPADQDGTMIRRQGAKCIISGEPMAFDYIRAEGKAGRIGAQPMAIVTEGNRGRSYYSPADDHARIAESAESEWQPVGNVPEQALGFRVQLYGMDEYHISSSPRAN